MSAARTEGRGASPVVGSLLGTAVGDAIGLPYEGLSRRRARRLLGEPGRHRLLPGHGMVSDDTEHACMVAQALIVSGGEPDAFVRSLGWGLRTWFLLLPAGIGWATLRACLRLWAGFSPRKSGVFSAGNGPAMRSAVIGAAVSDRQRMIELTELSARLTHRDPRAVHGAVAVALAASMAAHGGEVDGGEFLTRLRAASPHDEAPALLRAIERAVDSARRGESTTTFADALGLERGVSGFVEHSVPVALHAWLANQDDLRGAVIAAVACGGDTDTVAAITGGIVGAGVGREGVPEVWLDGLAEWPRSVAWMKRVAECTHRALAVGERPAVPRLFAPALLLRNALFTLIVITHGVRRLLPPY